MSAAVFVYVTFATAEEAQRLAREAIESQLAACVNILPTHQSFYRWNGKIEATSEHIALFKTNKEKEGSLREWIAGNHSYECPCIASFGIDTLNPEFEEWLKSAL